MPADRWALILGPLLFVLLFAACLQLLYLREFGATANAAEGVVTPYDILQSREVMTVACVLLAGLLGGYLQFVRERFDDWAPDDKAPASGADPAPVDWNAEAAHTWFAFWSQLIMGLGTAGVAALFVPLAIADPPALKIYNPWGLVMLGFASGYLSRHLFGNAQSRWERMFTRLKDSADLDTAAIGSEVAKSVLLALQPPRAVNYNGTVGLDVVDPSGRSCVSAEVPPAVELQRNARYQARLTFAPSESSSLGEFVASPRLQSIQINDGDEAPKVPFDLRLQTSFGSSPPADLAVEVDRRAKEDKTLPFDTSNAPAEPGDVAVEITVFVYQKNLFCAALTLPVRWKDVP